MVELVQLESGKTKSDVDDDEDMGLNFPLSYALTTWNAFRQFGVLPKVGGYNDQDKQLMEDWSTLSRRYNWAKDSGASSSVTVTDTGDYEKWG